MQTKKVEKIDSEALRILQRDFIKGVYDLNDYKENRANILDSKSPMVDMPIVDYNQYVEQLFNLLEEDHLLHIYNFKDYVSERKKLKAICFDEPIDQEKDNEDGKFDQREFYGQIYFDPKTCVDEHFYSNPDKIVKGIKKMGIPFLMRRSSESCTIIMNGIRKTYTYKSRFPKQFLYLFNNVKKDANRYLDKFENRKIISMPPEHPSIFYNENYDDSYGRLVGFDIDHAYWRIAMTLGIISKENYERGLDERCKALRLATLSVLGKSRSYKYYDKGVITNSYTLRESDPDLQQVYDKIRRACYNNMYEMSQMLGDDFECWKTDAIYFRDTPENRAMISKYLDRRNFTYKILDWYPSDEEE